MGKLNYLILISILLPLISSALHATEVCRTSMMGKICFEDGRASAVSPHMQGDAVAALLAETLAKKKAAEQAIAKAQNDQKVAENKSR